MDRKRLFNLASLVFNLLILFFTIDALWYNFRTDISETVRAEALFGMTGLASLCFFTNLSNLFVAATAGLFLFFNARNVLKDEYIFPRWALILKYVATVSVTVTLLTVVLFLGPYVVLLGESYFSLFQRNNLFLHFLVPVLSIVTLLFFERTAEELPFRYTFLGLIPTVAYSIVYLVMVVFVGAERGGWQDFYGFTFGGQYWAVPLVFFGMYSATYAFAALEWFLQRYWIRKTDI